MNMPPPAQSPDRFKQKLSEKKTIIIIVALVLCLIGMYVYYLSQNYQWIEKKEYIPKAIVSVNPFYAAEQLLRTQSQHQHENAAIKTLLDEDILSTIQQLPNPHKGQHTVFIQYVGSNIGNENIEKIIDWIEQGGHVITVSNDALEEKPYQKILNRLAELKKQQKISRQGIQDDPIINSIRKDELVSSNQLLVNLGIFLVNQAKDNKDTKQQNLTKVKNLMKQSDLVASLTGKQKQSIENQLLDLFTYKSQSSYLLIAPSSQQTEELILIKSNRNARVKAFKTELFDEIYAHKKVDTVKKNYQNQFAKTYLDTPNEVPVVLLRQYFQGYLEKLKKQPQDEAKEAYVSLSLLLQLSDDELKDLFVPINHVMVDKPVGKGRITVLSSPDMFLNPYPSEYEKGWELTNVWQELLDFQVSLYQQDNALLWLNLVKGSDTVWISLNHNVPTFLSILWHSARLAVWGLFLLTGLWLWSLHDRFGKIRVIDHTGSHDILRYFRQIGRFAWQQDKALSLIKQSQAHVKPLVLHHLDLSDKALLNQHDVSNQLYTLLAQRLDESEGQLPFDIEQARQRIKPNKLTWLLAETFDDHDLSPIKITEMTQTLWLVRWLLTH